MRSSIGGKRFNALEDDIVRMVKDIEDQLVDDLMEDGYPFGTEPVPPRDEYETLSAMRSSNDPAYWNNPQAQARLQQLSLRYGPPSGPSQSPFVAPGLP